MNKKELLAALPPEARKKLDAFDRRSRAASAESRGIYDEVHDARENLHHFQVVRRQGSRFPPKEDKVEKDRANKQEAVLKAEIQRLQGIHDEASQRTAPLRGLVERCFLWIDAVTTSGSQIVEVKPPIIGRESLATVRQKLATLDEQINQTERAPAPAGELLALTLASLDVMARLGEPSVSTGARFGDPLGLEDRLKFVSLAPVRDGVALGSLVPTSAQFLAWALEDVLKDRITKLIGTTSRPGAIDTQTRETKLRDLAKQKLELERTEEALICAAENDGFIPRRQDADIRAVLMVSDL